MALKIKASRVAEGASEIILQSGNATIGTLHTNALVLESNCADSLHAIVSETIGATGEKMYILVHISQEFPTLLNGKPVTGSTHLSFGDKVEIGTTSLEMIEVPDESDEPDEQDEAQAPLSNGPRKPRTFDESDLFAESDVAGDRPQNEDPFAPPQSVPLKIGEFAEELSFLEKTKLTLQKAEEKVSQFARLKISRMQRQKVALDAPNEAEKKSDPTSEKQTETGPKSDENHVRVSQASPEFSAPPHSVAPVAGTLPIQVVEAKSELPPLPPLQPSPPLQPVLSKPPKPVVQATVPVQKEQRKSAQQPQLQPRPRSPRAPGPRIPKTGNTLEVVLLWEKSIIDFKHYGGPPTKIDEQMRGNEVVLGAMSDDTLLGYVEKSTSLALVKGLDTRVALERGMTARIINNKTTQEMKGPQSFQMGTGDMAIVQNGPFSFWLRYVQLPSPRLERFADPDGRPFIFAYASIVYIFLSILIYANRRPHLPVKPEEKPWAQTATQIAPRAVPTKVATPEKPAPTPKVVQKKEPPKPAAAPPPPPPPPPPAVKKEAAKPKPPPPPPAPPKPAPKIVEKKLPPPTLQGLHLDNLKGPGIGKVSTKSGAGAISTGQKSSGAGQSFTVPKKIPTAAKVAAKVPAADPVLSGTLVKDEIEAVILANLQRFKECYLTHVKGVSPRWRVLSSFVVDPGGSVSSARMMGSPSNKAGENCMTGVLASLQFPSPRGGKAQVKYPFDFSPPVDKKAQEAKQVASALDFLSDAPPKKGKNSGPNKASSSTADATSITNMGMASKALSGSSSSLNKIAGSADSGSGPISTGGRAGGKMGGVMGGTGKSSSKVLGEVALGQPGGGDGAGFGKAGLETSGAGQLTDAEIEKALAKHQNQFQYCYEKALLNNPNLAGNVVLSWTVSTSGSASGAKVVSSQLNNAQLHNCISAEVQKVQFPAPRGGEVKVKYPFAFSSTSI